jgi:hypothetical protein
MISQQILTFGKIFAEPLVNENNSLNKDCFNLKDNQELHECGISSSKLEEQAYTREEKIFHFKTSKYQTLDDEDLIKKSELTDYNN